MRDLTLRPISRSAVCAAAAADRAHFFTERST
jgi:hypothetical protein